MLLPLDYGERHPEILAELADIFRAWRPAWSWRWRRHLYGTEYAWAIRRVAAWAGGEDLAGLRIMDAGGGASALQHYLAARGADVLNASRAPGRITGVMPSGRRVAQSRTLACDIAETGLPEGSFDAIVSVSAIEHNPWGHVLRIFRHLAGLLRPGGLLAVTVPAGLRRAWHEAGTMEGPKSPPCYLFDAAAAREVARLVARVATLETDLPGDAAYQDLWRAQKAEMDACPGGHVRPYLSAGLAFRRLGG